MGISRQKLDQAFKKKYLGKAIYQDRDRSGRIQVIEDGMIRSLHFDSVEKQSSMDLQDPPSLALSYTVTMMAGFLLNPDASSFLCIGLGGASIPRFLAHYLPNCHLDMVEIRLKVIDIARKYFHLPSGAHHRVFHEGAKTFIEHSEEPGYDMIFIDVYDKNGMVESIIDEGFFNRCREHLQPGGVFCINLWSEPRSTYREAIRLIQAAFGQQVFHLPVSERTNQIVLALTENSKVAPLSVLKQRSRDLGEKLEMPFTRLLRSLAKYNSSRFKITEVD